MAINQLPQVTTPTKWDALADQLAGPGFFVVDNFLSAPDVESIRSHALALKGNGVMKKAGIGNNHRHQVDREVRGDFIHWINPADTVKPLQDLSNQFGELRKQLNRSCYLGLKDMEFHLAVYPAGTFYKRHSDRFKTQAHRVISVVTYLNPNWQSDHGGQLLIYPEDGSTVEIEPLAGRLVLFRSEMEHEVTCTTTERISITGWMLDQLAELTFL